MYSGIVYLLPYHLFFSPHSQLCFDSLAFISLHSTQQNINSTVSDLCSVYALMLPPKILPRPFLATFTLLYVLLHLHLFFNLLHWHRVYCHWFPFSTSFSCANPAVFYFTTALLSFPALASSVSSFSFHYRLHLDLRHRSILSLLAVLLSPPTRLNLPSFLFLLIILLFFFLHHLDIFPFSLSPSSLALSLPLIFLPFLLIFYCLFIGIYLLSILLFLLFNKFILFSFPASTFSLFPFP